MHAAGAVGQPLRFQGQYADAEIGLHYNRFRYDAPDEGRFINQDPVRLLGGDNIAAYAPNPVQWVDPRGLTGCSLGEDTTIHRAMNQGEAGNFLPGASNGAPNANITGARTPASTAGNKSPTIDVTPVGENQMVGPSCTGQSGSSASLDPLPTRPGQVLGTMKVGQLPEGLGAVNDYGHHVSIFPKQDMTFPEFRES